MILFGHRGAAGEAPENTLAGFDHAVRVGVRAFEFDVRMTADGELVVFHDETLTRTTGVKGRVEDATLAELAGLDARHHWPGWPEPVGIPTLREVLDRFGDLDAYQIEIKRTAADRLPAVCAKLLAAIGDAGVAERVEVSSFQAEALLVMRDTGHRSLALIGDFDGPDWLSRAAAVEATGICPRHTTAAWEVIKQARQEGLRITGWPCVTRADYDTLRTWAPDAITTDLPTLVQRFLAYPPGRTG